MDNLPTRPFIDLDHARVAVEAARAKATDLGISVVAAVVDPGGLVVTLDRMAGAPLLSMDLAVDKAWTAVSLGSPTQAVWDGVSARPDLVAGLAGRGRISLLGGGVPIVWNGTVVGAIGVSGGTAAEDVLCAESGVEALG